MKKFFKFIFLAGLGLGTLGAAGLIGFYSYLNTDLPDVSTFKPTYEEPLRVYDRNGELLATYGSERRIPLRYEQFPKVLVDAVISIEDRRFFEHSGIDPKGMLRAAMVLVTTGKKAQGASTITQQVARNFFLSSRKEYIRKLKEIILSLRMERNMTKEEILAAYMNKIFLGHRSYGFAEAARTYFNKSVDDLTLPEAALLAGLQQSPSRINPIANKKAARERRNLVLAAMLETNKITQTEYDEAVKADVVVNPGRSNEGVSYVTELVRQAMFNKYHENAYKSGFKVYTTIDQSLQKQAEIVVRRNLIDYDRRHGWRPEDNNTFLFHADKYPSAEELRDNILIRLKTISAYEPLYPAVVLAVDANSTTVLDANNNRLTLKLSDMKWAGKLISEDRRGAAPKAVTDILAVGQLVYIETNFDQKTGEIVAKLGQIPAVNSGLVSLDVTNGAIEAMVGGFSYERSSFNRATQATVQVGSSFKPFVYAAAFEKYAPIDSRSYSWGTIVNDEPIAFKVNGKKWQPKNSGNSYKGLMPLRTAFAQSRNTIAVKLIDDVGDYYMSKFLQRFGFSPNTFLASKSLALGTANFTPLEMARAYAVFVNGGFLINPYIIDKVTNIQGDVLYTAKPLVSCSDNTTECDKIAPVDPIRDKSVGEGTRNEDLIALDDGDVENDDELEKFLQESTKSREVDNSQAGDAVSADLQSNTSASEKQRYAPRILSRDVAYFMWSGLQSNVWGGYGVSGQTGIRAQALKLQNVGGKTGTTNDSKSAWFVGYVGAFTTATYVAFDDAHPLGRAEFGGTLALVQWVNFEQIQLKYMTPKQRGMLPWFPKDSIEWYRINTDGFYVDKGGFPEMFRKPQVPPTMPVNQGTDLSSDDNSLF